MCDLNLFDLLDDDVQLQKGLWSLSFFYIRVVFLLVIP